jgi:hypothetical protein
VEVEDALTRGPTRQGKKQRKRKREGKEEMAASGWASWCAAHARVDCGGLGRLRPSSVRRRNLFFLFFLFNCFKNCFSFRPSNSQIKITEKFIKIPVALQTI